MSGSRNFLLGKGERLTAPIPAAGRPVDKVPPYTVEEARTRLRPMFENAVEYFDSLPDIACPHDQTVGSITLNPEYIAKSYFPSTLLRSYGLRSVGSKATKVVPEKKSKERAPEETITTELFVSGSRTNFRRLVNELPNIEAQRAEARDLPAVEKFSPIVAQSKIKSIQTEGATELPLEIVLHAGELAEENYIVEGFEQYIQSLGLEADLEHRFYAGGLCFIRMVAPKSSLPNIAQYSFLRALREMPKLRLIDDFVRAAPGRQMTVELPSEAAVDTSIRVAVFDGGVPANSPISKWVKSYDTPGVKAPQPHLLRHGVAVTSALLFGNLTAGQKAPRPFVHVDHYRVLDGELDQNPLELFDVLERIKSTLTTSPNYDFVNLSLGPRLPIDDDDVHAWTAVLDEHLAKGTTLATVAVGNDGDAPEGLNRVQVPSDCVNALSIGACTSLSNTWKRAAYSCVGPGRSPGLVKPDLVAFGGADEGPYYFTLQPDGGNNLTGFTGTSFAAPHALRIGSAIKAQYGPLVDALSLRALLIHTAEPGDEQQHEIGWGRVQSDTDDIMVCPPGVVRIVYQGELTASKYLRAKIPMPAIDLKGKVKITATCCFSTEIDSAHPSNYTRSGIEIAFRPNDESFATETAMHPKSETFFSKSRLYAEDDLRSDAHKWETCLHASLRKLGSSLKNPVFDLHYMARDEGHVDHHTHKLRYALVITVEAPRHRDLYDQVVRSYRNILEPITPRIQVPVVTG